MTIISFLLFTALASGLTWFFTRKDEAQSSDGFFLGGALAHIPNHCRLAAAHESLNDHLLAPYPSEPWYPPPYTGGTPVRLSKSPKGIDFWY